MFIESKASMLHFVVLPFNLGSLLQRNLLKRVDNFEAASVLGGKRCIAWSVDHQRLHSRSDRSLDLLDVVAKEENAFRRKLERASLARETALQQFEQDLLSTRQQSSRNWPFRLSSPH